MEFADWVLQLETGSVPIGLLSEHSIFNLHVTCTAIYQRNQSIKIDHGLLIWKSYNIYATRFALPSKRYSEIKK